MSTWPAGVTVRPIEVWPGTLHRWDDRRRSPFTASWSSTLAGLTRELNHLDAERVVVQMAVTESMIRADGTGVLASARPDHPGVVLAMHTKHGPLRYACDSYTAWRDNLRGIVLTLDALRRVDRYGAVSGSEQYAGWKQIEAGPSGRMTENEAQAVLRERALDLDGGAPLVELWRNARRHWHPDRSGGSRTEWDRVEQAARVLGLVS